MYLGIHCPAFKCKSAFECIPLVGSLKLYVSFAKEPKIDYILQKRPIILMSLLIVATPYLESVCVVYCRYIKEKMSRFPQRNIRQEITEHFWSWWHLLFEGV